jgi:hypothetical protein
MAYKIVAAAMAVAKRQWRWQRQRRHGHLCIVIGKMLNFSNVAFRLIYF